MRSKISTLLLANVASFLILFPTSVLASATTGKCLGSSYTSSSGVSSTDKEDVGVFMVGVCQECWDLGDCGLNDILTVVANIGNYILSIVAGLVFLVYILGGFWWIASHGNTAWVTKGRTYIKNATLGLIIVLFAYAAVATLEMAVKTGEVGGEVVVCDGSDESLGKDCGDNSICTLYGCASECQSRYSGQKACLDTNIWTYSGCEVGLCPGETNIQCCDTTYKN